MNVQLKQAKILFVTRSFNNFGIQKYYQNEAKLSDVYSTNNLPKIKDGAYVIYFDEY